MAELFYDADLSIIHRRKPCTTRPEHTTEAERPEAGHGNAALGPAFAALLLDSHLSMVGRELTPRVWKSDEEAAQWLYNVAPFGLLAHDTAADPCFIYANRTAQRCFGYPWEEFRGLPSRLSAAPEAQQDRDAFVEAVTRRGFADGYRGRRIRKGGSLFWIADVRMWDLVDAHGQKHGQAALFPSWFDEEEVR
ncbi:MEKHLA domain-containing protein [Streptomyces sp. NPDC005498]|uniref:MEKHLA domain-containing protein n=1 Tax=Streptomyces sp. NPDC005498 TaxID=3364717 RepID=UPI0036781A24